MLSAIRNHTQSFVVKILAALLIGSFAIWGVEDMFDVATSNNSAIYEIGDIEGNTANIENAVHREINNLRRMLGNNFGTDEAKSLGIVDIVLQRQIDEGAFLIAARKLGVEISDDLVRQEIQQNEVFKGLLGFDKDRFNQVLRDNFMSESAYISSTRNEMSRNHLLDSLSSDTVPKGLVETIYKHRQEKRTIETIFISDDLHDDIPDPSEKELIDFHKKNANQFTAPEYREVSVIQLKASDLATEILVTDEELKEGYATREDEFTKNETRHVKQMIFSEEAIAQKAVKSLSQGSDFTLVAKEIAKMDAKAIDLGKITYNHLPFSKLADVVFALDVEENSTLQKSSLGWHLFRVDQIEAGGVKPFNEVKRELQKTISYEKAVDSLYELANKLEDTLGSGASLEEAAGQLDLKVLKITSVDNKGRGTDGNLIKTLPGGNFIGTTFSTDEGAESPLNETNDDGYFVLRVDSITAPILKPLTSIKREAIESWKASERSQKSRDFAEKIVKRINAGNLLSSISAETGLKLTLITKLVRNPQRGQKKIPRLLTSKVFGLQKGKASMARNGDGYTIARLKKIIIPNPSSDKTGVDELSTQLNESLRRDIKEQLATALRDRYGVKINSEAVSSLFTGAVSGRRR